MTTRPSCLRSLPARLYTARVAALRPLACALVAVGGLCVQVHAEDADVAELRQLAARDPDAARQRLAPLREQAVTQHKLARRLGLDEIDCRILSDTDGNRAREVALAGHAALSTEPSPGKQALAAGFRLQACGAGVLIDLGGTQQGNAELDRVIAMAGDDPVFATPLAMALLERGLHRSRRDELLSGQADLLRACAALEKQGEPGDLDLCRWHLAQHYKRTGDTEEALALLLPLLEAARQSHATSDIGVYVFGLAQVRYARSEWQAALDGFEESRVIAQASHDSVGVAYAEHGSAQALLRLGRASEALTIVERESTLLAGGSDPVQDLRRVLLRAQLLIALARPAQALPDLDAHQAALEALQDDAMRSDWLLARANAQAGLGRWREAYADFDRAHALETARSKQQLSEQAARWRMQFNREHDAAELGRLRAVNAQGEQLRQAQVLALGLFVILLALASWFAIRKVLHARRMQRLAMVDELTGLPNRRALLLRLEDQLRRSNRLRQRLSVLLLDVDHFKRVNDTHGHGAGDEVLRHLAGLLGAGLRAHDWVGRLGGEEFLAVLVDATPEQALAIAERMRRVVEATPCPSSVGKLSVTLSVGLASTREGDESVQRLIDAADVCLYEAKHLGRNQVCVESPAGLSPTKVHTCETAPAG